MSDFERVREFTKETGNAVPNTPVKMTEDEVYFLIKMLLDEILELAATVDESYSAKLKIVQMIVESKNLNKIVGTDTELIAEQGDALVDMYYYSLNAAAKKGINLSKIFDKVHDANMAKRDPVTNKFILRHDGKVMKPEGWKAPDIIEEIERQMKENE